MLPGTWQSADPFAPCQGEDPHAVIAGVTRPNLSHVQRAPRGPVRSAGRLMPKAARERIARPPAGTALAPLPRFASGAGPLPERDSGDYLPLDYRGKSSYPPRWRDRLRLWVVYGLVPISILMGATSASFHGGPFTPGAGTSSNLPVLKSSFSQRPASIPSTLSADTIALAASAIAGSDPSRIVTKIPVTIALPPIAVHSKGFQSADLKTCSRVTENEAVSGVEPCERTIRSILVPANLFSLSLTTFCCFASRERGANFASSLSLATSASAAFCSACAARALAPAIAARAWSPSVDNRAASLVSCAISSFLASSSSSRWGFAHLPVIYSMARNATTRINALSAIHSQKFAQYSAPIKSVAVMARLDDDFGLMAGLAALAVLIRRRNRRKG